MRRHLVVGGALVAALSGAARAQAPAGAPPAAPPDPPPGMAQAAPMPEPPPPTPAAPPPVATPSNNAAAFGLAGQLVVSGDLQISSSYTSFSMSSGTQTAFVLRPSLDYFVAPNVSIGGFLDLETSSYSPPNGGSSISGPTSYGVGARAGYNIAMGPFVSFWPQLKISYNHFSPGNGATSGKGYYVPLSIDAPFLFHLAPHFFVGIGPSFSTDLVSKTGSMDSVKSTSFGVASVVGGYFGG